MDEAFRLGRFSKIAERLEGATNVVNTSFTEPYLRSTRRMGDEGDIVYRSMDPKRHKQVAKTNPDLPQIQVNRALSFLKELSDCAKSHGMELRVCSNPEFDMPQSKCSSTEIFSGYDDTIVEDLKPAPTRPGCQCLKSVDIGMDNTCIGGCKYCYVVVSQKTALRIFENHDPCKVMLR